MSHVNPGPIVIRLVSPVKAVLEGYDTPSKLRTLEGILAYRDKKVYFEHSRIKNNPWECERLTVSLGGPEGFLEYMSQLKASINKSLLFRDEATGELWTYSGLAARIRDTFSDQIVKEFIYPEPKLNPWATEPKFKPRPYQTIMHDTLLEAGHAGVEVGTGLGKSFVIQLLTKTIGRQTLVMAPSASIARQIFNEAEKLFGKKRVGLYGDGKKDFKKQIVIAIGASLTRLEKGTPAWEALSKTQVFIADESHQTPAATLQKVCFGLVANAPYRFFFSGTQIRNDGLDLVLEAITGPIVYRMNVREGVDQGYLAKPIFTMIRVESDRDFWSKDSNALTRAHGFYNERVIKLAAEIANKSVSVSKRPVLILIEEMGQFAKLLPLLKHEVGFAHGGTTKDNKEKVPEAYHESDPNALVKKFNDGEFQILVGTSCIATGTDIQAAKHIIYLRFGASPIELRQGVGRGTRLVPGKTDCYVTDFIVENVEALARHANTRAEIMEEIYGPVRWIKL